MTSQVHMLFNIFVSTVRCMERLKHVQVTKKCSEGKQARVEMEASKTNQTRWESMTQHFHTIPTSCAIFRLFLDFDLVIAVR